MLLYHFHLEDENSFEKFFLDDAGGREGVLVVWQLDTGKKKFLPRIGSPLLYILLSPDSSLSSVSTV